MAGSCEDPEAAAARELRLSLRLVGREELVALADGDEGQPWEVAKRVHAVLAVAQRTDRLHELLRRAGEGLILGSVDGVFRRVFEQEARSLVLPECLGPALLDQRDGVGPGGAALGRVRVGTGTHQRKCPNALGLPLRHCKRRVAAQRGADQNELVLLLAEDRLGVGAYRPSAAVEPGRDHLVLAQGLELRLPHPLVERERVQQDDLHSAETTARSSAMAGRSEHRSSQSSSAGPSSRSKRSRPRRIQGM
jgi:hypothetical protein